MTRANADLFHQNHRVRNALEDYADLMDAGVPHERALQQIGYTPEQWDHIEKAALRRDVRSRQRPTREPYSAQRSG